MTDRCKAVRLACWNADGVRRRKLELEHFLSQDGVDICLLNETFLKPGQAWLGLAWPEIIQRLHQEDTLIRPSQLRNIEV